MKKYILYGILFLSVNVFAQKKWTLQESIDYAIKNNLQVVDKQYLLKAEENNLKISENEYLPVFSIGVNNNLRFGQTQGFQGSIGKNDNLNNDIMVSSNILLYNGGRLEKQRDKKKYDVEAAQHSIAITQDNITLQIIQQYLSVLLQKEILKVNRNSLENAQKSYNRAQLTTEAGTTARTILAEAKSALAKENQNVNQAEIEVKKALFSLAQTLQIINYKNFDIKEIDAEKEFFTEAHSLGSVLENVYTHHPIIRYAKSTIKSVEAQTQILKTAFMPTIALNAGIGSFYYNSLVTDITGVNSFGDFIREKSFFSQYRTNFYQQVGVSINIPIFNKGNSRMQVIQSKINEEIAKNDLEIKKQELLQSIQKIYFDIDAHYQSYISAQETEKSTKLALDFAEKSYEAGINSIYDLNNARNSYTKAQSSVIQSKYNYIFSRKILEVYMKQ